MASPASADDGSHPLIVFQRALDSHVRRTEHWGLALLLSRTDARIFEIVGNTDSFGYVPRPARQYAADPAWRGGYTVGRVAPKDIDALDARLRALPIVRNDPEFDCQTWVLAALRILKHVVNVPDDLKTKWAHTSISASCTKRSSRMSSGFCCACGAGSTVSSM